MTSGTFQIVALGWLGAVSVVGAAAGRLVVKNWGAISTVIVAIAELRERINEHDAHAGIDTKANGTNATNGTNAK